MSRTLTITMWLLGAVGCSGEAGTGSDGSGAHEDVAAVPPSDGGVDGRIAVTDGTTGLVDAGGACSVGTVKAECQSDADCNDGNPATVDTCQLTVGGEFPSGTCLHAACDGGLSCVTQAVDPTCANADAGVVYPPFVAIKPPDVPAACANGFQLTDAHPSVTKLYTIHSRTAAGSRAITLDLDFATYTAPDGLQVTGVDGACKKYTLFDSCRLKTGDSPQSAYTDGMHRPKDIAIRQYHLDLRPGTTQLTFDFSRVVSPMYVEVLGLCDFTLPSPPAGSVQWFALVP